MKNAGWLILSLVLFFSCTNPSPKVDDSTISKEKLKQHIQYLASAELKGRKTNEPGYLKAAEYVANYCQKIGLNTFFEDSLKASGQGWYQQVPFLDFVLRENNWLSFGDEKRFFPDKGYFLMNSGNASGLVSIDSVLFAGYAIHEHDMGWDDFSGRDINGKYVMMVDGIPDENDFPELYKKHQKSHISLAERIDKLYYMGAAGLIVVSEMSRKFWKLSARINEKLGYKPIHPSFWADPYHPELPVIMIHPDIFKAYFPEVDIDIKEGNYPEAHSFKSGIKWSVDIDQRIFNAPNVAGFIQGSDSTISDEVIILSAHLDHIGSDGKEIFYGANDNASSVSVLIEIAKQLVLDHPKRTIIFVFYAAEEPCMWGSQYFVSHYTLNKGTIVANINVEMCGIPDQGNRVTTAIGPLNLKKYFEQSEPLAVNYLDVTKNKDRYSGSDQLSFHRQGIPAIRFGNLDYPEKHTSKDEISIIDFNYLRSFAETLYHITKDIANH
jgi:hypothetical protein